jgi:hypothetical protein
LRLETWGLRLVLGLASFPLQEEPL